MVCFCQVDPAFVLPDRPAYDADARYLGAQLTPGVSKWFNNPVRILLGSRAGVHNGAANADNPSVEDELTVSVISAFSGPFYGVRCEAIDHY
jgi:hypothetical protein